MQSRSTNYLCECVRVGLNRICLGRRSCNNCTSGVSLRNDSSCVGSTDSAERTRTHTTRIGTVSPHCGSFRAGLSIFSARTSHDIFGIRVVSLLKIVSTIRHLTIRSRYSQIELFRIEMYIQIALYEIENDNLNIIIIIKVPLTVVNS